MIPNNLIENVVRKVILEYSGVSDEIMDISQEIMSLLFSEEKKYEWKMSSITGDYFKRFSLPIEGTNISNIVSGVLVKLFYYNPKNMNFEIAKEVYTETGDLNLAFSPSREIIKLFIPFPNGGIMDDDGITSLISSINHEVKHAYQHKMRGGTTIPTAYSNSIKPIHDDYQNNDKKEVILQLMRIYIRELYYIFDKDEIDARAVVAVFLSNGNTLKYDTVLIDKLNSLIKRI